LDWLTGFIEYDYYNFGTNTEHFVCAGSGLFAATAPFNIMTNINVVKAVLCGSAVTYSFDHLVAAGEQHRRHFKAKRHQRDAR
jgi:hypothetical protein